MAYMMMSLRAVNHRLTNLPVKQLPHIASSLAASLTECGELLSTPQSQKTSKGDSEGAVQIHKLTTRLASLLQDRTVEGRWTAVVLIKALVEAGQWEVLRGSEPFVRGLISILAKSDPDSTKVMAVITLTRIFHLTYQYPTLVREITTPSLPGFITSTLNLISTKPSSEPLRRLKPNTPFLEIVFHAYTELIARHPTIFRPFSAQIHSILQKIIGSTDSSFPQPVVDLSEQLFIALHHCAPKNTGGEEWKNACRMTITSIHGTLSYVFRAIVEQWESVDPTLRQISYPQDYSQEVSSLGSDPLGLDGWQGVHSGVDRTLVLLRLLSAFMATATASTVTVPVGSILDLTSRLTAVTVPSDVSDVQANPQISRVERDHLLTELPRIHVGCLQVLLTLVNTLESAIAPVAQTILEQMLWVFRAERTNREVRGSTYNLIHALLPYIGPSMTKKNVSSLTDIIRASCADLLPADGDNGTKESSLDMKGKSKSNQTLVNADSFLNPGHKQSRKTTASSSFPRLTQAASELLPTILTYIPIEYLSPPIRAEIDRTIIMTSDKQAMYASVLNPFPAVQGRGAGVSIIPFLARSYPAEMDVEGLIRPRMPVLTATTGIGQYSSTEEEEEEEEEDAAVSTPHPFPASTGFLKPSSTPNLHQDLMDVDVPQKPNSPPNKRNYVHETEIPVSEPSKSNNNGDSGTQNKKVRFENNAPAAPTESVLESQSILAPSSFTDTVTSARSVQVPVLSETTNLAKNDLSVSGASVSSTGPPVHLTSASQATLTHPTPAEDDSDDEMPTLNLEPDTDDEEEE